MDLQLKDKLSLVTGSTAGIGYAIAETLVAEGAKVIINGRSQESVDKAITTLRPKAAGDLLGFAGDLSEAETAAHIAQRYPDVEILVNNLGIFEPLPFEEEFFEKMRPTSLIKRFATPEEVASLVVYVVSPLASATTGAALRVDGGTVKSAF
jgi:NAD(P)-dependent dehydrogenase (short-subunit alcohol dehydrogenase family)